MAKVQAYTKFGVDAKFNSRSNMTMVHNGGGSPDISAYPDSKTGDVIERASDGARWSVVASTITPIAGRVLSVAGKAGNVTLGPGDVGAAPSSHTHTLSQISDLRMSDQQSFNTIVKRSDKGHIRVAFDPVWSEDATSKRYVDNAVTAGKAWSAITGKPITFPPSTHTHTVAQVSGLNLAVPATASTTPLRGTDGTIITAAPTLSTHAATKKYVDDKVASPVSWSNLSDKPSTFTPSTHTHTLSQISDLRMSDQQSFDTIVKRSNNGHVRVSFNPIWSEDATSKQYVDTQITESKAWSAITDKPSTFPPSTHSHTQAQVTGLPAKLTTLDAVAAKVGALKYGISGSTQDAGHLLALSNTGRIVSVDPLGATDIANKNYVDSQISSKTTWANTSGKPSTFPPSSHTHTVAQISNLNLSTNATGSSVVQRDSSGRATVSTPTATGHATTKAYVDNAVTAGKAWSAITDKPSTFPPSSHTHTLSQISDLRMSDQQSFGTIVTRSADGNIRVSFDPIWSEDATSKRYVDNAIQAAMQNIIDNYT